MLVRNTWMWAKTDTPLKLGVANTTDRAQLEHLVGEAFDRILMSEVGTGRAFVVKPNLGFPTDEKGGTTSLALLAAVLNKIQREYAPSRVYVVESDGIAFCCEEVFEFLELGDLCTQYQATLVNLSRLPRSKIHFPSCRLLKEIELPSLLVSDEPILINLAKIKTHEIARFSGAIKNLYGLNPYIFKIEYHPRIDNALCDVYQIFKPALTLIDGLWAVDGRGPWTGQSVELGVLIASDDALAADLAALRIIGWQPQTVSYLKSLLNTFPALETAVDSLGLPSLARFKDVPATNMTLFKERIARLAVPFLKWGMPLIFPSQQRLRMVRYGPGGQYCRSITTWQGFLGAQREEEKK